MLVIHLHSVRTRLVFTSEDAQLVTAHLGDAEVDAVLTRYENFSHLTGDTLSDPKEVWDKELTVVPIDKSK